MKCYVNSRSSTNIKIVMTPIKVKRYGKFIPIDQTGNYGEDGFHNAPVKRGFYCFDYRYEEDFLVGEKRFERDLYYADIVGGFIWIHLEPKKTMIQREVGGWYQIRVEDYHAIIKYHKWRCIKTKDGIGYSKDHLEIFCDHETILKNTRKVFNKLKTRGARRSCEMSDAVWKKMIDKYNYYSDFNKNIDIIKGKYVKG